MSLDGVGAGPRRLLPGTMEDRLLGWLHRMAGAILLALAAAGWLALATWSARDPSLGHGAGATTNLLGSTGAVAADLLLQTLGFAAILVLLAPAVWGWELATTETVDRLRRKVPLYLLSLPAAATAFSALPRLAGWPLRHGQGGILGDALLGVTTQLLRFLGNDRATLVAGLVLAAAGMAATLASLGIGREELRQVWWRAPRPPVARGPAGTVVGWRGLFGQLGRGAGPAARDHLEVNPLVHIRPPPPQAPAEGPPRPAARARPAPPDRHQAPMPGTGQPGPRGPAATGYPSQPPPPRFPPAPGMPVAMPPSGPYPGPGRVPVSPSPRHLDPVEDSVTARDASIIAERFKPRPPAGAPVPPPPASVVVAARPGVPVELRPPLAMAAKATMHAWLGNLRKESAPEPPASPSGWRRPPLAILKRAPAPQSGPEFTENALNENARLLEQVLGDFGVKGQVTGIKPGPVVTLFELEPARGTKSSRVIGLADDIARSMSAVSVRVAVVPGRSVIGIELPNVRRETVYLRELMEQEPFRSGGGTLPVVLGKGIGGEPIIADLARMPHLLVAGTTGSGKSVGVNAMILSLLYKLGPEECRFIMIDPKMLELSVYNGIPHLLAPVVTEPQKAVHALGWVVREMEERYKRMAKLGVRNIGVFNNRVREARRQGQPLARTVQTGFDPATNEARYERENLGFEPLPYIVVVVDELADLMLLAGKEIEGAVQRLAQMARAAGIHLIMATQRPSVDVITGTIKANFPTRISFKVTSKIDSRTILNEMGAEQLLGQGDMLYASGGGQTVRVHGPFVSDEEVEAIAEALRRQGLPQYIDGITDGPEADDDARGRGDDGDALYERAVAVVTRDRKTSVSYLQRRLAVGFNRAADLIERMEKDGIVSPPDAKGHRDVLVGPKG